MRLDDPEAKGGSGTSPSNGGGSQDSIDMQWFHDALSTWLATDEMPELEAAILDWHNTQLKAALRTIHKTIVDNNVAGAVKWQVEDMQAELSTKEEKASQDPPPGMFGGAKGYLSETEKD